MSLTLGDVVTIERHYLGKVVELFTAPNGEPMAAVKTGPNPHQVSHYCVSELSLAEESLA